MSPSRSKLSLVLVLGLTLPAAALYALYGSPGYEQPEIRPGEPPRRSLLARAIAAHGGADRLREIRTVFSHTIGSYAAGRQTEARVTLALPDRYHHDVTAGDARLVLASNGEQTWSTLDGVPVPVDDDDLLRLREEMARARCGLLVDLESDPEITTTELGFRDDLEWLEVDFDDGDVGPFLLGFHRTSHLLTRAEWKASMTGRIRKAAMSVTFTDHREIDGVMIGFEADVRIDDAELARDTIQSIQFGGTPEPSTFTQPDPPSESPIIDRTSTMDTYIVLEEIPGEPVGAEKIVATFLEDFQIRRNGPTFRDVDGERTVAVGVPVSIDAETQKALPAASRATPRHIKAASRRMLTTVVIEANPERLRAAEARLLQHAKGAKVEPVGPIRQVTWKDGIVQVQLPVKGM